MKPVLLLLVVGIFTFSTVTFYKKSDSPLILQSIESADAGIPVIWAIAAAIRLVVAAVRIWMRLAGTQAVKQAKQARRLCRSLYKKYKGHPPKRCTDPCSSKPSGSNTQISCYKTQVKIFKDHESLLAMLIQGRQTFQELCILTGIMKKNPDAGHVEQIDALKSAKKNCGNTIMRAQKAIKGLEGAKLFFDQLRQQYNCIVKGECGSPDEEQPSNCGVNVSCPLETAPVSQ